MSARHRSRSGSRGQALAETALILPVFLLILMGIFDLGRAVFAYTAVGNAAREGARVATVNQIPTASECDESRPVEDPNNAHWAAIACAVMAGSQAGVTTADVTVSYAAPTGSSLKCTNATNSEAASVQVGCMASVTVQTTWHAITPIIGSFIGPITLRSTSVMPIERVFP